MKKSLLITAILVFVFGFFSITKAQDEQPSCLEYGTWAYYDYISETCKCSSGYTFDNAQEICVSKHNVCEQAYGFHAMYDIVSNSCVCEYGYELDEQNICTAKDTMCKRRYGEGAVYSILNDACQCKTGYAYIDGACQRHYNDSYKGQMFTDEQKECPDKIHGFLADDGRCYCEKGYEWGSSLNKCIKLCGINAHQTSDGQCACDEGHEWVKENDPIDCKKSDIRSGDSSKFQDEIGLVMINNATPQLAYTEDFQQIGGFRFRITKLERTGNSLIQIDVVSPEVKAITNSYLIKIDSGQAPFVKRSLRGNVIYRLQGGETIYVQALNIEGSVIDSVNFEF